MKKLKIIEEFKEFAVKGNVVDMAVGVIIGGAFGKIVSSLVNDMVMPLISVITGRISIADLAVTVAMLDQEQKPIEIRYGLFLQNILDFLIVAVCIFAFVKVSNIFKKKQSEAVIPEEKAPSQEEALLTEIRDILKDRSL